MQVFVSPGSKLQLSKLRRHYSMLGVKVREKPFGLVIRGPEKKVQDVTEELRRLDPTAFFIRESAPATKGHRIFRGFLQISGEYGVLPLISNALSCNPSELSSSDKITEARIIRCRYVHEPLGHVDVAVFKAANGESQVRCLDGEGRCGWYNCTCCPYGTLIERISQT